MADIVDAQHFELDGVRGRIVVRRWDTANPSMIALLAHGYGEHAGRYQHVAEALNAGGAVVYAADHMGHGLSGGERALITDFGDVVSDFAAVLDRARAEHADLPVVVIGHSLGGIVATRLLQTHDVGAAGIVLSGPVIGGNADLRALIGMDPIPEVPIDPAMLSRDPAVGEAYAADELVYHGPFRRETLVAVFEAVDAIADGPHFGGVPTLWVHGEEDPLAPLAATKPVVEHLAAESLEAHVYPGAKHEVLNETNREEVLGHVTDFVGRAVRAGARA